MCSPSRVRRADTMIVVVVPRLCSRLVLGELRLPVAEEVWGDCEIELPQSFKLPLKNLFTGETPPLSASNGMKVSSVLKVFPVALLCATLGAE